MCEKTMTAYDEGIRERLQIETLNELRYIHDSMLICAQAICECCGTYYSRTSDTGLLQHRREIVKDLHDKMRNEIQRMLYERNSQNNQKDNETKEKIHDIDKEAEG